MLIRKLSVGPDYKTAMHYIKGQSVLRGSGEIDHILWNGDSQSYEIWIKNEEGILLWKTFQGMPVSVEHDITF